MITTKTGDKGQTTCGNKRVDKDDILVELIGAIDELQSILELVDADEKVVLDMGMIMGILGCQMSDVGCQINDRITTLEKEIEEEKLTLDKFVVFKTKKAKEFNWARTVCRRVERRLVTYHKQNMVNEDFLRYFNRLSDYLFLKAIKNN